MALAFGDTDYGKIDRVPGVCYIITRFAHINFLPIWPSASYLVVEGTEKGCSFRGKTIPFDHRSVLCGYLRMWLGALTLPLTAIIAFASCQRLDDLGLGVAVLIVSLAIPITTIGAMFVHGKIGGALLGVAYFANAALLLGSELANGRNLDGGLLAMSLIYGNPALIGIGLTKLFDYASPARRLELLRELGIEPEDDDESVSDDPRRD